MTDSKMDVISVLKELHDAIISIPLFRSILFDAIHIELLIILFIIILLIALNYKDIKQEFIKIRRTTWILLIVIFVIALSFRLYGSHYHIIFYDENYINSIARNILIHNKAGQCTSLSFTLDAIHCNIIQPFTGWSVIIFIAYFLFGVSEYISLYLTSIIGALTVFVVFILSYILFKKESYALISSFLVSILTSHIIWSKSSISNIVSLFLIISVFAVQVLYSKIKTKSLNMLMVLIFAYVIQTRIENLIYLPIILLNYFLLIKGFSRKHITIDFMRPWFIFAITLIFYIPQVIAMAPMNIQGYNLFDFLKGVYQPFYLYIFMIIGLIYSIKNYLRQTVFLVIVYIITLLFFSRLYVWDRYYLLNLIVIIVFEGIGLGFSLEVLVTKVKKPHLRMVSYLMFFILALEFILIPSYNMIKDGVHIKYYQILGINVPRYTSLRLDKDCFVVSNALDEVIFSSGTLFKTMLISDFIEYSRYNKWIFKADETYAPCFLFYEGMGCKGYLKETVDGNFSKQECKQMHNLFDLNRRYIFKEEGIQYALYSISEK